VYLKSAREHLEVIETRMAPAKAPPRTPVKAVVGFLRAGEPIEEHHGQGGQRGARAGPATGGGGDRGSSEAGEDATGIGISEMRAAQRRGKPTRRFHETGRSL
jgi:hypothetical protein